MQDRGRSRRGEEGRGDPSPSPKGQQGFRGKQRENSGQPEKRLCGLGDKSRAQPGSPEAGCGVGLQGREEGGGSRELKLAWWDARMHPQGGEAPQWRVTLMRVSLPQHRESCLWAGLSKPILQMSTLRLGQATGPVQGHVGRRWRRKRRPSLQPHTTYTTPHALCISV